MEGGIKKNHSKLGVASVIIILIEIILFFSQNAVIKIVDQLEIYHDTEIYWALMLGLPLVALVLGIFGLIFEKNQKKIFPILGILISISVEMPLVVFYTFAYIFLHSVMNH